MRLDPRLDSADRWMDSAVLKRRVNPSKMARRSFHIDDGDGSDGGGGGEFGVRGAYLFPAWWSARSYALYTLHNDVYRRTDGNNRLESKYLTLFRAMFRLAKSAAYSGGLEAR